jgi:hypothetical protein
MAGSGGVGGAGGAEQIVLELTAPEETYQAVSYTEISSAARFNFTVQGYGVDQTHETVACSPINFQVANGWTGVKSGTFSVSEHACFAELISDAFFWFSLPSAGGTFRDRGAEKKAPLGAFEVTRWEVSIAPNAWSTADGTTAWRNGCVLRLFGVARP